MDGRAGLDVPKDAFLWRPTTSSRSQTPIYHHASALRKDSGMSYSSLGIISPKPFEKSRPLRRFWGRTLALVLGPATIAGYFIFIWQFFLKDDGPVKYGTFNESWIFYSWFVVGVFGLSISRYGIIGIEAAMLQDPFWKTNSLMGLLMHSGGSWAGAGGWARCLIGTIRWKKSMAGRLWYALSLLTIALFVGLPISGLSFELADGYIYSSEHPMVIGRTWSNYHSREVDQALDRGRELWKTGASVSLPGVGLAYTPTQLDRGQFSFLGKVPNSLPTSRGVPELFLAPQADGPINGNAWGLRLSYNCSIVESASEFTILDRKRPDNSFDTGESRSAFNSSNAEVAEWAISQNLWAYAEVRTSPGDPSAWADSKSPSSDSHDDVYESGILEYALWQIRLAPAATTNMRISIRGEDYFTHGENIVDFDSSLDPSIPEIGSPWTRGKGGLYEVNETFFSRQVDQPFQNSTRTTAPPAANIQDIQELIEELATPIGVRCRHMSVFGTARLDAKTTSFTDFTPAPPVFDDSRMTARTPMFGISARKFLPDHYFDLFTATNSPAPQMVGPSTFYTSFVKPEKLVEGILRAYAQDALSIMYDGLPDINGAYQNTNLTSSRKGKILELGVVPPLVPAIWLSLWAFVSALLGLAYGFRRRWSAALDGYTLFRFGANFGDEMRGVSSVDAFEECERLWELPGFIGDMRHGENSGYISLVPGEYVADREKMYV